MNILFLLMPMLVAMASQFISGFLAKLERKPRTNLTSAALMVSPLMVAEPALLASLPLAAPVVLGVADILEICPSGVLLLVDDSLESQGEM